MSLATLAGHRATSARATIPAWGCWYADASIDGEVTLAGAVELVIADLHLKGTVLSGGPSKGRSEFRIVAGAGGWGRTIAADSYANDAGTKVAKVLGDAARLVGETLDASTIPTALRVGPGFSRREGPAARVLEQLVSQQWYVGEDGVTRYGRRAPGQLPAKVTHGPVDLARGSVTLASESIATILPGLVVDGLEAVDVEHAITKDGLRSTVWGARGAAASTSRQVAALKRLLEQLDPNRDFRAVWEYRVVTLAGNRLNLQPVLVSTGMPDLQRVPVRPGVAGAKSTLALGARVLVGFVNADPSRPVVLATDDPDGDGFKPVLTSIDATTVVKLADGARPMPATGDLAGGIWPIVGTTRVMG